MTVDTLGSRLNWLRAGVVGANDGIVSVAGLVASKAANGTPNSPDSSPKNANCERPDTEFAPSAPRSTKPKD
jgi:hypothetical protein